MAFAAFSADHFAGTRQAKPLGGCLVGFQLGLAGFGFARHSCLLLSTNLRQNKLRGFLLTRGFQHRWDLLYDWVCVSFRPSSTLAFSALGCGLPSGCSPFSFFFGATLLGASTTSMVRPSICGGCSTVLTSESAAAISFRSS